VAVKLDEAALAAALLGLPAWRHDAATQSITRDFAFSGFSEAFGFIARIALAAAAANHHPDWSNSYNKVDVTLSTHDAKGLTRRDIELAQRMDQMAAGLARR